MHRVRPVPVRPQRHARTITDIRYAGQQDVVGRTMQDCRVAKDCASDDELADELGQRGAQSGPERQ